MGRQSQLNIKDFTLVELSIVLVIIGLLIGGILVGQSLIESAKLNAQVAQIQQFDAGVLAFKTKYKFLPGDIRAFGGNGDGLVTSLVNTYEVASFSGEIANFWYSMFSERYIRTAAGSPGSQPLSSGSTKNVPAAKLGDKTILVGSALGSGGLNANITSSWQWWFKC